MMNIIWALMLIAGFCAALFTGRADIILDSMTAGCKTAVELCIELCGAYMLWSGIMECARDTGVVDYMAKKLQKPLSHLFPDAREACAPIALNLTANFFGMGSAATPFGIEAMEIMQKSNPTPAVATDDMCMFTALNASAIDLLPVTVIALRSASGASDAYAIAIPTFIASVAAFISAVIVCRLARGKK